MPNNAPQPTEEELREMARQSACPSGEFGLMIGEKMAAVNQHFIRRTVEALEIVDGDSVLELGHASGRHVADFMTPGRRIRYAGLEVSQTMVEEARRINAGLAVTQNVTFQHGDGLSLPFDEHAFDKIFTVNTIYFWERPVPYLREIARVMKPGGRFCLAFVPKAMMETLPFVKYGFHLYHTPEIVEMQEQASLKVVNVKHMIEDTLTPFGVPVKRSFVVITSASAG